MSNNEIPRKGQNKIKQQTEAPRRKTTRQLFEKIKQYTKVRIKKKECGGAKNLFLKKQKIPLQYETITKVC